MKLLIENWRKYLTEDDAAELEQGLKQLFSGRGEKIEFEAALKGRYPQEFKQLEDAGLLDRYRAAALAANKKEGKVLNPEQYLRQSDELDKYLGIVPQDSGGGKPAIISNIQKMHADLRSYDAKFQKDAGIRRKYEAAVAAINALLNAVGPS